MLVSPRPGNGVAVCRRQLSTLIGVATIAACDAGTVSGEQASRADAASDEAGVAYAGTLPAISRDAGVQTLPTELTVEANTSDLTSLDASVGEDTDASVASTSFTSSSEAGAFVPDSDAGNLSLPLVDAASATSASTTDTQAVNSTSTASTTDVPGTTLPGTSSSTADVGTSTSTSVDVTTSSTAPSGTSSQTGPTQTSTQGSSTTTTANPTGEGTTSDYPPFEDGPPAGNPDGECAIPEQARLEDVSQPDHVVGTGSSESCTADAFIAAVAQGGVITFDCGPEPVVITLDRPAKVFNNANPDVTIDGGGLVTLSGGGATRILYMNTCDEAQVWTTPNCDNQDHPRLSVQNLTFIDGNSKNETEFAGGGAIYASGGRFKVINSRFFNNVCADDGPDVGGAGIRVFQQYNSLPAYVVNSTFGGAPELGNVCSNGGGISSIGVSWTVLNSVFSYNQAIGVGGNPPDPDTLGGGSGGAIYNDGATMTLTLCGSVLEHNEVNMYGSSIFFVSNSHTGSIFISSTVSRYNTGGGWDALWPGISMHEDTYVSVDGASIIE